MNKIKGIVCYSGGILFSVLTFVWFALAGVTTKVTPVQGDVQFGSETVYKLFTGNGVGLGKTSVIFAIIALVLASLLLIACVIGLLNHFGILKAEWISWVTIAIASLFVIAAIVSMACMIKYCGDNSGNMIYYTVKASCGVGLILPVVSSLLALISVALNKLNLERK